MKTKKIKIVNGRGWYTDLVGKEFEVSTYLDNTVYTTPSEEVGEGRTIFAWIAIADTEPVKKKKLPKSRAKYFKRNEGRAIVALRCDIWGNNEFTDGKYYKIARWEGVSPVIINDLRIETKLLETLWYRFTPIFDVAFIQEDKDNE